MCGRLNVSDHTGIRQLMADLGMPLYPEFNQVKANADFRPTQLTLSAVAGNTMAMQWGIKPSWSKSLLINAKSETAHEKKTFAHALNGQRCLIPCDGWYEWKAEDSDQGKGKATRKRQYGFTSKDNKPLLMAGIWFEHSPSAQFVTLTQAAVGDLATIHNRMPLLIPESAALDWLNHAEKLRVPAETDLIAHNHPATAHWYESQIKIEKIN